MDTRDTLLEEEDADALELSAELDACEELDAVEELALNE